MLTVENPHWTEVVHDPQTTLWASHILLGHVANETMTEGEQKLFGEYLTDAGTSGVQRIDVRTLPDAGLTSLCFRIEADYDQAAVVNTVVAALSGLRAAGYNPDDFLLSSFNLETEGGYQAALAAGRVEDIRDNEFIYPKEEEDLEELHRTYTGLRQAYGSFDEKLLSELGIE